jgi:hypothetical protein
MKISGRQQFPHSVFYPLHTLHAPTAGTVSVATAMILVVYISARIITATVMMHSYG